MTPLFLWGALLLCAAAVFYGASGLSRYGDILAEKTGLGRAWSGVVLMAVATSLPELMTAISSVTFFDTPDIAAGDVLGACMVNFLIIALLDLLGKEPISGRIHEGHIISAAFVIMLAAIVLAGIFLGPGAGRLGWIGLYSIFIPLIYAAAVRLIHSYEKRKFASYTKKMAEALQYEKITLKQAARGYLYYSAVILASASWLPLIGDRLALLTGLGQTFIGSIFIAVSTTLPELTVALASLRMGAADMAVGSLLGSNLFNILILAAADFFYTKGPVLEYVSRDNMMTAISIIIMSATVIAGISYRVQAAGKKPFLFSWVSAALITVYILNMLALYPLRQLMPVSR
ncbi:MAG: hypothetical protein M0Z59_08300 [Nitrospiraceae bacterium]|nr:hypothetical protein [Nitrospiraceae bacterium]